MVTHSSSPALLPGDRRLYLITPARPDLTDLLEAAVRGGVDIVQLRDKELPDSRLLRALEEAREVTLRLGVPLVVNDRPDLAVLVGADLVHVGQDDLPVAAVRRFGLPVGLSTHAPEEGAAAARDPDVDYLSVGPVHATPTKPGRAATGLGYVRWAAEHVRDKPWFAIGGIDRGTLRAVTAAGARRVVVVRAITDAADPEAAARELVDGLA